MAQTRWGVLGGCLLEEILLHSQCMGVLFNLRVLVCGLHGWGPKCDELHLLVEDPHQCGVEVPPPPHLVHQFLYFTQRHPVYVHMNIIRVLLCMSMLNKKHWLHLGLEEVLYAYTFKRHNLEKYYPVVDAKSMHLVTNLSNTSKNKL